MYDLINIQLEFITQVHSNEYNFFNYNPLFLSVRYIAVTSFCKKKSWLHLCSAVKKVRLFKKKIFFNIISPLARRSCGNEAQLEYNKFSFRQDIKPPRYLKKQKQKR